MMRVHIGARLKVAVKPVISVTVLHSQWLHSRRKLRAVPTFGFAVRKPTAIPPNLG